MNRRQKIIVSVTGIFIVLLILIGLTYAYFLTRITGNGNPTSISVTTANLELVYGDGTSAILTSETPIEPDKFTASKDFTITNNGNAKTDYAVTLEDFSIVYANNTVIDGEEIKAGTVTKMKYPEDLKMTITCIVESDDETRDGQDCGNIDGTLPTENSIIFTNSIEVDDVHNYVLTLTYIDSGIDQSADMNKTIKGKIDIIDPKSTIDIEGKVLNYQSGDYIEINSIPVKSEIVDGNYKIIGVEPGNHTIYVKYKDSDGNIQTRGSQGITIQKGEESNVSGNTITFTEDYRIATVDINTDYTLTVDETLKKLNYTLSEKILLSAQEAVVTNDETRTLYNDTFNLNSITGVSAETDRILALTEDDYGTSYVFRGAVKDNYVKFAGFTWRIVRINGDGSIRLILDGTLDLVKREGLNTYAGTTSAFNTTTYNDNAYVGYMHGLAGTTTDEDRCLMIVDGTVEDKISDYTTKELCESNGGKWTTTAYEATHANVGSSNIKTSLDIFYETYIENNENNYHYEKYLADSIICGDKSLASDGIGNVSKQLGYGKGLDYKSFYAATDRLYSGTGTTLTSLATPILKCAEDATNNYSRYTKESQKINGVETNGDLIHPIGLMAADELVMAGGFAKLQNQTYYLHDANKLSYDRWWLMTPYYYNGAGANLFFSTKGDNYSLYANLSRIVSGVRPVINLKADLLVKGDGTENSPYEIKEIN